MPDNAPFKRQSFSRQKNKTDELGTIVVTVTRAPDSGGGEHTKGNITKTFRIVNERVSTVSKAVEEFLFGGGA